MNSIRRIFFALLACVPLALGAAVLHLSPYLVFGLSALAVVPLAKFIGDATDRISTHVGSGAGGLLNATFGNAPELIIGMFALHAGLIEVVKASIIGSVLGNLLFVLGTAIFVGGISRERQKFNPTAAKASGSMFLLAVLALSIPALLQLTVPTITVQTITNLSLFVSVLMIFSYSALLLFSLRTHSHLYQGEEDEGDMGKHSLTKNILILGAATLAVTFVSDTLVGSIQPLIESLGWSQLFIGAIVVAIVGNAAEHGSAIGAAYRNKMSLALSISVGSATQIVMFVAPVLVLVSILLGHQLNLVFGLFELVTLILAIIITNAVIEDGESNWLEGVQLLVAYGIIAVAYFLHP